MTGSGVWFGLQASPVDRGDWIDTVRRAEDLGFEFLCVGDHPGTHPSPMVALAAAAAVTDRIKLGAYVTNVGVRHPIDIATDIATLDIISDGRAMLGLGAGHTPAEWNERGRLRPAVKDRVQRLIDVAIGTKQLLAGEMVSLAAQDIAVADAALGAALRRDVPLLIGGNNRRILAFAAEHADVIGLTGLGRTLEGGHKHELRWELHQLEETFEIARSATGKQRRPEIQALVQWAEITDDPQAVANKMAHDFAVDPKVILDSPFILLGTVNQILERIEHNTDKWGIESYVVRRRSMEGIGQEIAQFN